MPSAQEVETEEEGLRMGWGEALLSLSSVLFSLGLLPMEYIGKFKIYTLTTGSRMPKESLHLQHNAQKFLPFGTLKLYSHKGKVT